MPVGSLRLDYDPPPPPAVARRACLRRWLLRALICVVVGSPVWWGPKLWNDAKTTYWHRACAAYTAPADQIVYEEDLAKGRVIVSRSLPCWDSLQPLVRKTAAKGTPVAFLGMRDGGNGGRQLIAVEFEGTTWSCLRFRTTLIDPPGCSSSVCDVSVPPFRGAKHLRIYAGQGDAVDTARVTIPYEIDGRRFTLDCRIKPGGGAAIDAGELGPPERAGSVYRLFRGPTMRQFPPSLPPPPEAPVK
jgi:hypothetical protein